MCFLCHFSFAILCLRTLNEALLCMLVGLMPICADSYISISTTNTKKNSVKHDNLRAARYICLLQSFLLIPIKSSGCWCLARMSFFSLLLLLLCYSFTHINNNYNESVAGLFVYLFFLVDEKEFISHTLLINIWMTWYARNSNGIWMEGKFISNIWYDIACPTYEIIFESKFFTVVGDVTLTDSFITLCVIPVAAISSGMRAVWMNEQNSIFRWS